MSIIEEDVRQLKNSILEMWSLAISQVESIRTALLEFDKDLANDVNSKEKRLDAIELRINKECELFILKNPFATDLRFVLATLRITNNLERIGDYANAISKIINDFENPINRDLINELGINTMFDICLKMLDEGLNAYIDEDSKHARTIFKMDKELNVFNRAAPNTTCILIEKYPDKTLELIQLLLVIKKLERVGDQTTNIVEEIIFHLEAKKLSHKSLKKKMKED